MYVKNWIVALILTPKFTIWSILFDGIYVNVDKIEESVPIKIKNWRSEFGVWAYTLQRADLLVLPKATKNSPINSWSWLTDARQETSVVHY